MVEDYQKALDHICTYGYRCCAFKHGIRDDRPRIPDGIPDSVDPLPPKFLMNLGCSPPPTAVEAKAAKVHLAETTKDPVKGVIAEERG